MTPHSKENETACTGDQPKASGGFGDLDTTTNGTHQNLQGGFFTLPTTRRTALAPGLSVRVVSIHNDTTTVLENGKG